MHSSLETTNSGSSHCLTPKQPKTHVYVLNTVATDALVLKHQAISAYNADWTFTELD